MDGRRTIWRSLFGGVDAPDKHSFPTTGGMDNSITVEIPENANRIVSLKPSVEKEERFKAVAPGKITSDVDIDVGPKGLTLGFTTEDQGKTCYKMPDVTNAKYKFVKAENNPKIKTDAGDEVINFTLLKIPQQY